MAVYVIWLHRTATDTNGRQRESRTLGIHTGELVPCRDAAKCRTRGTQLVFLLPHQAAIARGVSRSIVIAAPGARQCGLLCGGLCKTLVVIALTKRIRSPGGSI